MGIELISGCFVVIVVIGYTWVSYFQRAHGPDDFYVLIYLFPSFWGDKVNWDDSTFFNDSDVVFLLERHPSLIKYCSGRYMCLSESCKGYLKSKHPETFSVFDLLEI